MSPCPSSEIAVSPNNSVVNIYEKKGQEWAKIHELTEHSGRITGTVTDITYPTSTRGHKQFLLHGYE